MSETANVVICGAGIAGISAAYSLAVLHGIRDILLVDERSPLTLTSDKSTECYRNWWPGPGNAMVSLSNRSIDIMEKLAAETGNSFHLNRRGYLYLTADPQRVPAIVASAQEPSRLGAGPLRVHRGAGDDPTYQPSHPDHYRSHPEGADLFLDPGLIRSYFPYITSEVVAALHVRRAGWFSAQQLGMVMLEQAREMGVGIVSARVTEVDVTSNRVKGVRLSNGRHVRTQHFVNAAGPYLNDVARMLDIELPVYNELHLKVAFRDPKGVLPRNAPLLIWTDPQELPWSSEERDFLAEAEDTRWLLQDFPPGAHTRPEGGPDSDIILFLWEFQERIMEPVFPPPMDDQYPEVALRGLARMLPGLSGYFERSLKPQMDGGYYTKTRENRPLIGLLPISGAYVIGALSGFGLMTACAAGELLAAYIVGADLPSYAPAFSLDRYQDPKYQALLANWPDSGQL
jgi:glycine/D-amino acid oxidase-like deaminating enzyme